MWFMVTRLLILWLLAEGPHHGYSLKAILTDPGFAPWFALEDASIYAMLRSLVKQGLAEVTGEERVGNRPARTRYRITPEGRWTLAGELPVAMAAAAQRPEPVHAALAAADEFEPCGLRTGLAARREALVERRRYIRERAPAAPSQLLARRELALLAAELAWLEVEIRSHDRQWGAPP